METRASYVIVGSFVLAMIVALFAFIIYTAKVQFDQVTLPYHIYFSGSVTGLQDGSPVRYRGVPIGTVQQIEIDPVDASLVRVRIEVASTIKLTQDAIASIEMQGITGVAYIQVVGGKKDSPIIARTMGQIPVIPSKPSQISEFLDAAPELMNRLIRLTQKADQFLSSENADKVGGIISDLEVISKSFSTDSVATLSDIRKASDSFAKATSTMEGLATNLNAAASEAKSILDETRAPLRDFANTSLYELGLMIVEMRQLATMMTRLMAEIERDPSGFILSGPRGGVEIKK
jgi:phospholipid/cholesterol/gamma-HCH transport system substrate-binding protein